MTPPVRSTGPSDHKSLHRRALQNRELPNSSCAHLLRRQGKNFGIRGILEVIPTDDSISDLWANIRDYSDSEATFTQKELPLAPPSKYVNRLALPSALSRSSWQGD